MTGTRRPTEARRTEIADAALRLIGARGVAALTVNALAGELGLTGGALYRHYPSTEAILEAVAARAVELLDASTPPEGPSPREWLREFAAARTATVGGHAGLSRLLLSEQFAFALPASAHASLAGAVRKTREGIVRVLAAGQACGEFRRDLPPQALAPVVMGTIQMIAMQRAGPVLPRVEGDPLALLDTLLALLAPPARESAAKTGGTATTADTLKKKRR